VISSVDGGLYDAAIQAAPSTTAQTITSPVTIDVKALLPPQDALVIDQIAGANAITIKNGQIKLTNPDGEFCYLECSTHSALHVEYGVEIHSDSVITDPPFLWMENSLDHIVKIYIENDGSCDVWAEALTGVNTGKKVNLTAGFRWGSAGVGAAGNLISTEIGNWLRLSDQDQLMLVKPRDTYRLANLDASTGQLEYTPEGTGNGYPESGPLLPPQQGAQYKGEIIFCTVAGTIPVGYPNAGEPMSVGDLLLNKGNSADWRVVPAVTW
jgi:hypothetical protein